MSPKELSDNLATLAGRLNEAGITADFYLVGGAAMSIGYLPDRRLTTDIDAKVKGFEAIRPFVEALAEERNLEPDWLNTSASKLISPMHGESDWILWRDFGSVRIFYASAELLLVMKVAASRPQKDGEDIRVLLMLLGFTSILQVEHLFERHFPGESLPKKAYGLLSVLLNLTD